MEDRSDSETTGRWRRTPSRARERSRSSVPAAEPTARRPTDPQRGEAPEDPTSPEPPRAEWQPPDAAKGAGFGKGRPRATFGRGGKRGQGKHTADSDRGGKGWWQRGEAPARADSPSGGGGPSTAPGKGKREERLTEGEMLRCVWPAAPGETFRREGKYSLNDVLETAEAAGAKVEIRGRERKNAPLQRILVVTAPPGQADGLFLFLRTAARIHNRTQKLPKLAHCTRAEIDMNGVLVHTLRAGISEPAETDHDRWLEFMKQPLAKDFSSDSDIQDDEPETAAAAAAHSRPAQSSGSGMRRPAEHEDDEQRLARAIAEATIVSEPQQSPRGEAPGARRGEAHEHAPSAAAIGGTAGATGTPANLLAQTPTNLPTSDPLGPPAAATEEPPSVLLPQEEAAELAVQTFHDTAARPKPLFLSEELTVAFQVCSRFVQDCSCPCFPCYAHQNMFSSS